MSKKDQLTAMVKSHVPSAYVAVTQRGDVIAVRVIGATIPIALFTGLRETPGFQKYTETRMENDKALSMAYIERVAFDASSFRYEAEKKQSSKSTKPPTSAQAQE